MANKIKILYYILIIPIITSLHSNASTESLKEYERKYREGPTCNLTGIYLSLLPNGECVDLDEIPRREKYEYTINFMWINKHYSENQKYVLPREHNYYKAENYLDTIINWALETNDDTIIQIWYDSETTSEEAVVRTKEYFLLRSASENRIAPIVFRDLRSLPIVQEKPKILDPKLPIFLRVDLMKTIIIYNDIVLEGGSYSVFADIDVRPMSNEDLYDTQTMKNLEEYGFVMGDDGQSSNGGLENQFQILSYHNKKLLEAWGYAMVTLNVVRILNAFGDYEYYHDHKERENIFKGPHAAQRVFYSDTLMFNYFQHLSGEDILMIIEEYPPIPYNRQEDGLEGLDWTLKGWGKSTALDSSLLDPRTDQGKELQKKYKENKNSKKKIPIKDIDTIIGQSFAYKKG